MKKLPTATRVSQTPSSTKWRIELPSTARKPGKVYFATTYRDSQLIYVTTGANQRPVPKGVGRKLHPKIRAAIDAVLASELPLAQCPKCHHELGFRCVQCWPKPVEALAAFVRGEGISVEVCKPPAESALVEMFNAVPPVGPIDGEG